MEKARRLGRGKSRGARVALLADAIKRHREERLAGEGVGVKGGNPVVRVKCSRKGLAVFEGRALLACLDWGTVNELGLVGERLQDLPRVLRAKGLVPAKGGVVVGGDGEEV